MDADCLIKLTKAQLKELACHSFDIVIPALVKREVVDAGSSHPDAALVGRNINEGLLGVIATGAETSKGEEAALALFRTGNYDGICSDDKRFIARLRAMGIPYITAAVFVLLLLKKGCVQREEAFDHLEALAPFVSDAEYAVVKLKLEAMPG